MIQAGTEADTYSQNVNAIYPFWEMLNDSHRNTSVRFAGDVINPGDQVEAWAHYDANYQMAWMAVTDWTINTNWYIGYGYYNGDTATNYYDGTTADFITEEPPGYKLRKPYLGNTYFNWAEANNLPIANFDSWRIYQYNGGWIQGSYFDGIHAWTDPWNACL